MNDGFLTLDKQVELKPYIARPFKTYELMTEDELRQGAGGYLIVDTENYLNYFLIAFKNIDTKKYFLLEPPFDSRLLSWILHSYTTISFNGLKYDIPLMWFSYYNQDLIALKQASNQLISGVYLKEFESQHNIQIFGTSHVDLIEVCPLRGSLKLYGARLHAKRIQDVPFNPYEAISSEEINIVRDYCINDLDTTHLLLNNLSEQLNLRSKLSVEYKQNLMSKSDAQIAEAVISSELKRLTGTWPKKPKIDDEVSFYFQVPSNMRFQTPYMQGILEQIKNTRFSLDAAGRLERGSDISNLRINIGKSVFRMGIGGLHSSEECIGYRSKDDYQIYDRDVASYYPAIVLNCHLYPSHLGEAFLKVYQALVDRRLNAKRKGARLKKEIEEVKKQIAAMKNANGTIT